MGQTNFSGFRSAYHFAYGVSGGFIKGLAVSQGNTTVGASALTVYPGYITTREGIVVFPLSITAPIIVGTGANAETVTPTAVTRNSDGSATIAATFANLHGNGDLVGSGTFGLVEAVNYQNALGGGFVTVDAYWAKLGGVNATISGNKGYTNVTILDLRGSVSGAQFSYAAASNGANYAVTTRSLG